MKVMLLGSGGRESALAWALQRSPSVDSMVALPGNPGIARLADVVVEDPTDVESVLGTARRYRPDLVVIGPEGPLVAGVGNALRADGWAVFGPDRSAAEIEGSKAYAKGLMERAGIPTARWKGFTSLEPAIRFLDELGPPYVIKADGLAAGKGVVVTDDRSLALEALEERIVRGAFGDAGRSVVIEEFLDGEEVSLIAFCDGKSVVPCPPAQDYKRAFDGDAGPNTGGMGSYSPVPSCDDSTAALVRDEVLEPMVAATAEADAPFVGALYAGLALTTAGPKVVEFNARFGDPETQALLPRLRSDLGEVCLAAARGELAGVELSWSEEACVCVVLASGGYPGDHPTGLAISGIEEIDRLGEVQVFHAGTAAGQGGLVTAAGRVLGVSATGPTFAEARRRAYEAADRIHFDGKHARTDIGLRAELKEKGDR